MPYKPPDLTETEWRHWQLLRPAFPKMPDILFRSFARRDALFSFTSLAKEKLGLTMQEVRDQLKEIGAGVFDEKQPVMKFLAEGFGKTVEELAQSEVEGVKAEFFAGPERPSQLSSHTPRIWRDPAGVWPTTSITAK